MKPGSQHGVGEGAVEAPPLVPNTPGNFFLVFFWNGVQGARGAPHSFFFSAAAAPSAAAAGGSLYFSFLVMGGNIFVWEAFRSLLEISEGSIGPSSELAQRYTEFIWKQWGGGHNLLYPTDYITWQMLVALEGQNSNDGI